MNGAVLLRDGTGPPLLLLHGFTGAPSAWNEVARRLDPARRAIAWALPGHDPRRPIAAGTAFPEILGDLAGELEERADWHLAGYSMGARIALALLLERPRVFSRASLIGVHPGLPTAAERAARRAEDRVWSDLLRREGIEAFAAAWESRPLFSSQGRAGAAALEAQRLVRRSHDPERLARALDGLGLGAMPDLLPRLGEIAVPLDLIVGAEDARFAALARRMLPRLRFGNLVEIAAAGHNPLLERPEEVAAALSSPARGHDG